MSTFAEIKDGVVLRVIVIDAETLASGLWGDPENWVETFEDGSEKKNYAGIGYTLDKVRDAFIPPEPLEAIGFDEVKCRWIVPEKDLKDIGG